MNIALLMLRKKNIYLHALNGLFGSFNAFWKELCLRLVCLPPLLLISVSVRERTPSHSEATLANNPHVFLHNLPVLFSC